VKHLNDINGRWDFVRTEAEEAIEAGIPLFVACCHSLPLQQDSFNRTEPIDKGAGTVCEMGQAV
tara:strand:+ start:266 stop:457 length:192 start_codon:yes stop_codon:yes gene_type:complete